MLFTSGEGKRAREKSVGWGEGETCVCRGRVWRGAEGAILGDHSLAGLGCKKSTVI